MVNNKTIPTLRLLLSLFLTIQIGLVLAQPVSDLVVYTSEPDPFYLVLNGIKQNDEPMTNVRVTDLNQPVYDARVIFASGTVQIDKKIYLAETGMEYVYKVKEKKNGELTLRIQSATAFNLAPPPPANQQVIVYHTTPNPVPVTQQTVTTTTTTVTQSTGVNNGGVNMSVGVPGFNMNVNVNDPVVGVQQERMTIHESITTTDMGSPVFTPAPDHFVMPGYGGAIGCPWPMDENQFADVQRSVSSKDFDNSKLTVAKQITGANCLTADQVSRVMREFDFESNKLEYAKFAYNRTYDLGNYYKLNDGFDFDSSVDELNEFINGY